MGDPDRSKCFAQELKANTYNLTRMNLIARGIKADTIAARNGDSLKEDWPMFQEKDKIGTYQPLYIDAVVSNFPYWQKKREPEDMETDPRYRIFRGPHSKLTVTALFDPNIDNSGSSQLFKEDGLLKILQDYNNRFNQNFTLTRHAGFKKDVFACLAHKKPHNNPAVTSNKRIDLLIMVDHMLTGFDFKFLNTLGHGDSLRKYYPSLLTHQPNLWSEETLRLNSVLP